MYAFTRLVAGLGLALALVATSAASPAELRAVGPAAPGKYVGEIDGRRVTLTVSRNGRVMTGWVGQLRLRCGGYPELPTYPTVALDFPMTRIGKNGWLRRTWHGDRFTMKMKARFAGERVRQGTVSYSGPGRCVGSADWSARLKR